MKQVMIILLAFLGGILLVGIYSVITDRLFIQDRILQNPLGKQSAFSLKTAPSESLKGSISTFSGTLTWQSRTATQPAKLAAPRILQQGENVLTGTNGQAVIVFPKVGKISMSAQTEVDLIESLPTAFLTYQPTGSATYSKTGTGALSIRNMSFLVSIDSGDVTVTADQELGRLTVTTASMGEAKVAYNNLDNVSQVVTIPKDSTMIFDDATRSYISE